MKENPETSFFLERQRILYPRLTSPIPMRRTLSIRINTIRTGVESVKKSLKEQSIPFEEVDWYPDALRLPGAIARDITLTDLYRHGLIYIQSLSSMIPALVLNPTENDSILDMAAAPGSKTSQLAALMGNRGEIIANDIDKRRLFKLNAVLDMLGVENVSVTSYAGQSLWKQFPERFDKVLLDAPCSMEGTLFYPSPKKIRQFSKLQRWLLRSAVSSAKPGGEIVYSTCSMAPEENEEVVGWILEKEKGTLDLLDIRLSVPGVHKGVTSWNEKRFETSLGKTLRIAPSDIWEVFYVARLKKLKSNVSSVA